jgi:hypothetical protein
MGVIKLNNSDTEFLNKQYPTLNYDLEKNTVNGILPFNLKFGNEGEVICDEYSIEIDLNNVSDLGLPIIRETANRILKIAALKKIPIVDLHLNNHLGEMCIIIPPKTKERYPYGFDLKILLNHLQEHLYWISYYEKHDKAPWDDYGHGALGYLQLYLEDRDKYKDEFKKYFGCESRPKFRRILKELKKKYKI